MRIPRYSLKLKKKANGYQSLHIKNNPIEISMKNIFSFKKKSHDGGYKGFTSTQIQLFNEYFGGKVGIDVYEKLWVYARCVNMLSETSADLPYQLEEDGNKVENDENFNKFIKNPNSIDTGKDLRQQFFAFHVMNGNGYMFENEGPLTTDYWTLQSQGMRIVEGETFIDPIIGYMYTENSKTYPMKEEDILHMRSFNPYSRVKGTPRLTAAAAESNFLGLTDSYKNNLYKNQAAPSGAISTDHIMDKPDFEIYKEKVKGSITGTKNAGKLMFLDSASKFVQFSFNPADLDLIKSEVVTESAIATLMGVPIELLGHLGDKKNVSNYEASARFFIKNSVLPLGNKFAELMNNRLYPKGERQIVINEEEIKELQPSNEDLAKQDWTTPNEKRSMQGFEKSKDPNMEKFYFDGSKEELSNLNMEEDNNNR